MTKYRDHLDVQGPQRQAPSIAALAVVVLVAGAIAMAISPVFVRHAEVGPFTSAFHRVFLALPLLYVWKRVESRNRPAEPDPGWTRATVLTGLFFAGVLCFWHLSILNTTIANATFLATMAPVWVMALSLCIGERVTRPMLAGLGLCVGGAGMLIGSSTALAPERLAGDLYGIGTSLFYGLYVLAIRVARRDSPPGRLMFRSSAIAAVVLAVVAALAENNWVPAGLSGVVALLLMAFVSHAGGQGMLAFSLGHLSAAFSSLVIFVEAIAAALFGWLFFDETFGPWQLLGGAAILLGLFVARPRQDRARGLGPKRRPAPVEVLW